MANNSARDYYKYLVAIDFGTFSTSFSYAKIDGKKKKIHTVKDWPKTDESKFGGRVASACLYKDLDEAPLWGGNVNKNTEHLFLTTSIKSYLTDIRNQPDLPDGLNPDKLVSDYLKQVHHHGVEAMKNQLGFPGANTLDAGVANLSIAQTEISKSDENKDTKQEKFEESQIRYVMSYPDNQGKEYTDTLRKALEMAGIISRDDPAERLVFITESEATAYTCTRDEPIKYSERPYIVIDFGGTVFGLSTIEVLEVSETGTVQKYISQFTGYWGSVQLDKNIKAYLDTTVTASEEHSDILQKVKDRIFQHYSDSIKHTYTDSDKDDILINLADIVIGNTVIQSECIQDNCFVLPINVLKEEIFGPVTTEILRRIQGIKDSLKETSEIGGIFISGTIGDVTNLKKIIDDKFGSVGLKVDLVKDSAFAVSKGLITFGFRQRDQMVPYIIESFSHRRPVGAKAKDNNLDEEQIDGSQKIDFSGVDYIIGLDFGTTYSGFAYAKAEHCNKPVDHTKVIKDVKIRQKEGPLDLSKTPSMLYYDEKMNSTKIFGEAAKAASRKMKAKGILLRHFKLLLSRKYDDNVDDKVLSKLEDFQIVDAIANYLSAFNKGGMTVLKREEKLMKDPKVGYIITIPAMWPDEAKHTMKVAVKKAKLVPDEDIDSKVHFITEAEAAALYCERYFKDQFNMEKEQRFMICDAGGGTVDLVTFQISQDDSDNEKRVISELTAGDGDDCGSIYLDNFFTEYILEKFKEHEININQEGLYAIVDNFIRYFKPDFEISLRPDLEDHITLDLPAALKINTDYDIAPGFIENDRITIPYNVMENRIFTPVVDKVLDLIERQLRKLPENERTLDAILLVGGFGRSGYLYRKICDRFEKKVIGASFIGKPPAGDLAICRGAVSFGLHPRMVSEGITRYTYGLQVKESFRERFDDPQQKMVGYNGEKYCRNVFSPILYRNLQIGKDFVYGQRVFVTYPNDPVFAIYSTDQEQAPRLTTEMKHILIVSAKMPESPTLNEGDTVTFELYFEVYGTNINIGIYHDGKKLTDGVKRIDNIVRSKFTSSEKQPNKKKSVWISRINFFIKSK